MLRNPVMIAAFEGWNDAGDAATAAVEQLGLTWDATPLTELDPEGFYDFQVTRPTVRLIDGVTRTIDWPTTRLSACRLSGSPNDVILVHGIEPNFRWRAFCDELLKIAVDHQVSQVIGLGALLADVPHTRPIQVTGSAHDEETAARFRLARSRYEGPTGISGVFQDACVQAGIPSLSFWASVPHYVSQAPSPKATLALLHRVEEILDIEVPLGTLPNQADRVGDRGLTDRRRGRGNLRVHPGARGARGRGRTAQAGVRRVDRRRIRALPAAAWAPARRGGRPGPIARPNFAAGRLRLAR